MIFWKKKQSEENKAFQQKILKLDESIQDLQRILTQLVSRPDQTSSVSDSSLIRKKQAELGSTLSVLQNELAFIKNHLLQANTKEAPPANSGQIPVIYIQSLHIEHVDMKEVDLSNNLGQLGIKDLPGQLNIGTVYGKSKPDEIEDKKDEKKEDHKENPKVFIQRKKD